MSLKSTFVLLIVFILGEKLAILIPSESKVLLADVTSNKLTREHDGSFGMWSYHGTAKESHASKTSFIYNADLLTPDGSRHTSIASTVYPYLGLTSDKDAIYQEYLLMQAKVAGIDGFMIEWGHMNHSSNNALLKFLELARKYGSFKITINWCDHWLFSELENKTSDEIVSIFHANLQYLMDTVFNDAYVRFLYNNQPVIFLFGGGLSSAQLKGVQSLPLTLPPGLFPPLWVGSYLNFASSAELWSQWKDLLNGTFAWAPRFDKPTPSNMSEWDYYINTDNAVQYQANVSTFGKECVSSNECALWFGSVSPGFDNRGCAGWGQELRYMPRHDLQNSSRSTYDAQWQYHIQHSSPEFIVIPTINDFPEATPILPLVNSSFETLYSTAKYTSLWKGDTIDPMGVMLPSQWYQLYKEMQFYNQTPGLNVRAINTTLDQVRSYISQGSYKQAEYLLTYTRYLMKILTEGLQEHNISMTAPGPSISFTIPPKTLNHSYVINSKSKLYLAVAEKEASVLRANNYKGLLKFDYQSLTSTQHFLSVNSSPYNSKRMNPKYTFRSRGSGDKIRNWMHGVEGDRSEVCKLVVGPETKGIWQSAVVAVYKENQSWDHSALHNSDLIFSTDGQFLIRNISLNFTVFLKSGT